MEREDSGKSGDAGVALPIFQKIKAADAKNDFLLTTLLFTIVKRLKCIVAHGQIAL